MDLDADARALGAIRDALAAHVPQAVEVPGRRRAAVLLMLYERDGEPWIVLTRRTETVRTHKGEISFPGGASDDGDADLWATAVRETVEELGIDAAILRPLGVLDDYPTFSSGFVISPFVAAIERPSAWSPSEHEIAEVIELPLRRLAGEWRLEPFTRGAGTFQMNVFDVDGHRVWGVTAVILRRFLELVGPALGYQKQ